MSDFRVAVRRTNEWDGPSMLKIYTPYVEKTHYTPDTEVPTLAEYVQHSCTSPKNVCTAAWARLYTA